MIIIKEEFFWIFKNKIINLFRNCNLSTTSSCLECIDLTPCRIATKFSVVCICAFLDGDDADDDDAVAFDDEALLVSISSLLSSFLIWCDAGVDDGTFSFWCFFFIVLLKII